MTLQRPVVAQLTLQAGLTYKVRLAPAFPLSALTTGLFAVSSVLRAGCGFSFVDRWVAPGDGQGAALLPWFRLGSTCGAGKALRCCPGRRGVRSRGRAGRFAAALDGAVRPRGRADRCAAALVFVGSLPGTGKALRCCPGAGYGFLCFHAFVGRALLWPVRGVIAFVNTLLCVWGTVPACRVARRGFD